MPTEAEILAGLAKVRQQSGAPADPASDAIWARRILSGQSDFSTARHRIQTEKGGTAGGNTGSSSGGSLSDVIRSGPGGENIGDGTRHLDEYLANNPSTPGSNIGVPIGQVEGGVPAPNPQINYRAYAPSWMTGALLDTFVEHWSNTGDAGLAMEAVRRSPTYDTVFYGNRRADGSLRYNEQQWFATRDAFIETAAEFGVGSLDRQAMQQLFEQDVSAQEFMSGVGQAFQTFAEPGVGAPQNLMSEFLRGFTSSGSAIDAMERVRGSSAYDEVFRGNKREDGSLRMDEQDYYAYKRGWQRTLASYGLDPEFFDSRGRFVEAVEREVSIAELGERLDMQASQIESNIEQVREFYAQGYGLDLTRESILAAAIDPTVERDLFQRRISAAQIGGEAKVRGFMRSVERAEELARNGVTQQQARDLYATAERQLPALSATTQRYFRGATGIGEFEEASVLQDAGQQNRLTRALQEEQSSFTGRSDVRRGQDGLGLAGLRRRG